MPIVTVFMLWFIISSQADRSATLKQDTTQDHSRSFRIGGELGESEIAESVFFYATFIPVIVGFFLHCFRQFSGVAFSKAIPGSSG